MQYCINWEIYNSYAGATRMLLHTKGQFTMGKLKSSLLSWHLVLNRLSLAITRCRSIRHCCIYVFLYFNLNGIDTINTITNLAHLWNLPHTNEGEKRSTLGTDRNADRPPSIIHMLSIKTQAIWWWIRMVSNKICLIDNILFCLVVDTNPTKDNRGWIHVLAKSRQFLLLIRHPPCYS
jgi:hypothetical protein